MVAYATRRRSSSVRVSVGPLGARSHPSVASPRRSVRVTSISEMATSSSIGGSAAELVGRRSECEELDGLIEAVQVGESRALVVRGEPGVGKTALLEYAVEQASASGCRVERAAGVQSEMELAFAGLHQLCAPMLDRLERLPVPQRDALETAFGSSPGSAPDRFLVGRGRPRPALRGCRGAAADLPGGRRALARSRLGAGTCVRCAAPGGGVGRFDLRGAEAERRDSGIA